MKKSGFFWVSFSDLMISLFFIMLVLYVISFALYKGQITNVSQTIKELEITKTKLEVCESEIKKLKTTIIDLKTVNDTLRTTADKIRLIQTVEENLDPLKNDTLLFRYEKKYKRFTLAFDVEFNIRGREINKNDLINYEETSKKIKDVGFELKQTIDELALKKISNPQMKNVSYLVIISGYASKLSNANQSVDYSYSYERAYNLWGYWKDLGVDFEENKYNGLVDLQISGNGWGGVGRFQRDENNFFKNEIKNQRFIIQIIPKIGNTD